jgi:hypothetical protein
MPQYVIDDKWNLIKGPMSVQEISVLANEYQSKYFSSPEPSITIEVTSNPEFQGAACYEPSAKKIWLAERVTEFEKTLKIALLHEMIHANLHASGFIADHDHEHGPEFRAEVKRLMAAGAYDELL